MKNNTFITAPFIGILFLTSADSLLKEIHLSNENYWHDIINKCYGPIKSRMKYETRARRVMGKDF
jgi:hypothetical protein